MDFNGYIPNYNQVESKPGNSYWLKFKVYLPRLAQGKKLKALAIYGHGILLTKSSAYWVVARDNVDQGIATIVFDTPFHGMRAFSDGNAVYKMVFQMRRPSYINSCYAMPFQLVIDQISLLKAIRLILQSSTCCLFVVFENMGTVFKNRRGFGSG